MAKKFRLEGTLVTNIDGMDAKNRAAIVAAANFVAPRAETYMKTNAPWTDRTGAARSGLGAQVSVRGDDVAIVLFHSVAYGVYLENRWGGRYQIIRPAIQVMGPEFVMAVGRLMFK